ncbi:MAG TPA: endonuclease/exonuclease/phosphatase family protein [Candidatus Binatia bacterium]|nr:endonuclease/exonuclease/phosphatase family protein [Candidatus Binatia bacterium]
MTSVLRRVQWLRLRSGAGIALALAIVVPGVSQAKVRELKVMTQNLYLGSSLDAATDATNPNDFLVAVATIYATVQFTNFPARAEAIAAEVAASNPDVIGLQEVSNWISAGPGAPPSLDFLMILQEALQNQGLSYSVAAVSNNANIGPIPLVAPCSGPFPSCFLTFKDRDVILVNDDSLDLEISNPQSGRYETQEVLATPVGPLSFDRGWCSIDGKLDGKKFHFVNTHLETETYPAVQEAQGLEFLAGPAKAGGAVIATGDFNSAADGSTTTTYASLTKSYFDDAWDINPGDPGLSCCQNSTLTNLVSQLNSRIDLVLTHAASRALDANLIGDSPFEATPPFWASDHAGVIATLRIH